MVRGKIKTMSIEGFEIEKERRKKSRLGSGKGAARLDELPITISIGHASWPALHGGITRHGRH
jgi:hypothetical protein